MPNDVYSPPDPDGSTGSGVLTDYNGVSYSKPYRQLSRTSLSGVPNAIYEVSIRLETLYYDVPLAQAAS